MKPLPLAFTLLLTAGLILGLVFTPSLAPAQAAGPFCYVDDTAGGANNGTFWTDAYTSLQAALADPGCTQIYVAAGIYTPGPNRTDSFGLKNGVEIYGGFPDGGGDWIHRAWEVHITTLSGEIGDPLTTADNSYHVVSAENINNSASLDGFTITGGNADGPGFDLVGGGMTNISSSPRLYNLIFSHNSACWGGGMSNDSSSPTVSNVFFRDNSAVYDGGGVHNDTSNPAFVRVSFIDNRANQSGGGMFNEDSSLTLWNGEFINNSATIIGGGMYTDLGSQTLLGVSFSGNWTDENGGGMYNSRNSLTLTNVTFSGNASNLKGGGMSNASSSVTLTNVTFSSNSAPSGGGIFNSAGNLVFSNSILWGNTASFGDQIYNYNFPAVGIAHSIIQDAFDTSGNWDSVLGTNNGDNLDADPLFVRDPSNGGDGWGDDPATPGVDEGANDDYGDVHLRYPSPAVDAGDASLLPLDDFDVDADGNTSERLPEDLDGQLRVFAADVDLGAYESHIWYVDDDGDPAAGCETWEKACPGLQTALGNAESGDQVWVAAGVYLPGINQEDSFRLKMGVGIYGGFPDGGGDWIDRDPAMHLTTLSGEIGDKDSTEDNSYHVVRSENVDASAVLDGFTITAGNANGSSSPHYNGGGMFNGNGSPTLTNLTFTGNLASNHGGGMFNDNGSPTLTSVTFNANLATSYGGGMANWNFSNPTFTNVAFIFNSAGSGGGMANWNFSNPTLINVIFSTNSSSSYGGGMFNTNYSSPTLTNVTFSTNSAAMGGGMYNQYDSSPTLTNCILWGNTATGIGQQLTNSWGSQPSIAYCDIQGAFASGSWDPALGTDTGNNRDADPLFVNAAGMNLRLQLTSPAVDVGNNAADLDGLPGGMTISNILADPDGNPRIKYGTVDLGAYELQNKPASVDAGPDASAGEGSAYTFNGSINDPDAGDTHTIAWDFGDGGSTSGSLTPSHTYDDNGLYTVTLTVTDAAGEVSSDTLVMTVANVAPTATFGNNGPVAEGLPATITFSSPSDPSSVDTAAGFHYAFACDGGSLATATYAGSGASATTTCTYGAPGSYTVRGRIIDKDGGYTEFTISVRVVEAVPTAAFTHNAPRAVGAPVQFTDTSTASPADPIVSWAWDFDYDGILLDVDSTQQNPSHTYSVAGVHTVALEVTDSDGDTNLVTDTVSIQPSDIQVDYFSGAAGNNVVVVGWTILGEAAPAFDLAFYLSADNAFGAPDQLLDSVTISNPADLALGVHSRSFSLGIDLDLVKSETEIDQDYYLLAVGDPADSVAESDESNNSAPFIGIYQYGASPATVFVHGGPKSDNIHVNSAGQLDFNDSIFNYPGARGFRVRGHTGDDTLEGNDWAGGVALFGGEGDDTLRGSSGNDRFDGGPGVDLVRLLGDNPVNASLLTGLATGQGTDTLVAIENLEGSNAADTLTGDDGANLLSGGAGDDTLYGNGGSDILIGWTGNDTIYAGAGDDWIDAGGGSDTVYGGAGRDTLSGGQGSDYLYGQEDDDVLRPGTGADEVVSGGTGSDTVDVSDFSYNLGVPSTAGFMIELTTQTLTAPRPDGLGTVSKTLVGIENAVGSLYDDRLVGSNNANTLTGLGGADTLDARGGDDWLSGGGGNDTLLPGSGSDTVYGDDETDMVSYSNLGVGVTVDLMSGAAASGKTDVYPAGDIENVTGTAYTDSLTGTVLANELRGEAGDDKIYGLDGADTLYGGAGNDAIEGGADNDTIYGDGGNDGIDAGDGDDWVSGGVGNDMLTGGLGGDTLNGDGGADVLHANAAACGSDGAVDTLTGGNGIDSGSASAGDGDSLNVETPTWC